MTMNIVFLDFDGVLNSHEYMRERAPKRGGIMGIDRVAMSRLNTLLKATGANLVISSSWRHGRSLLELANILEAAGGDDFVIIGKTPDAAHKPDGTLWHGAMRGHEIQAWLTYAPLFGHTIDAFIILDDDSDMDHLSHRHIKTTMELGLTDALVADAIALMAKPEPLIVLSDSIPEIAFT